MSRLRLVSDPEPAATQAPCWRRIGVHGDKSCPELVAAVHCRNCPVFAAEAQSLFDRPLPPGYEQEWSRRLAEPRRIESGNAHSVLVFTLGAELLAFPTSCLVEIAERRTVHRIPHWPNRLLEGLVNVRGKLELCVSLRDFLGVQSREVHQDKPLRPRLLVTQMNQKSWVFPVDDVHGVQHLPPDALTEAPATLRGEGFTRGLLRWEEKRAGFLDADRLFSALTERLR